MRMFQDLLVNTLKARRVNSVFITKYPGVLELSLQAYEVRGSWVQYI